MPGPDAVSFAALLKRQRLAAGLTQEALAERAGLSAKAVGDLERDPDRSPRLGTVTLLADALGADPEQRSELLVAARPGQPARPGTVPVAAAGATEPPRWAMPRPLTPLIGRAGVAAAVVRLLRRGDTQLLTLTGPGGVGKTRLAIEVAERVAGDFADGAVFVDLAPLRDPGLVLGAIAQRLGVDERDATPLPDLLAAVAARQAAAGAAGQLRAPAPGPGRRARPAGGVPRPGHAGHQPSRPARPGRARLPGRAAGPARCGRPAGGAAKLASGGAAGRTGPCRRDGAGPGRGDGDGGGGDLPAAGRAPARHRAGRGPAAAAAPRGAAGTAGPPAAGADRRAARPAGPAADHAGRDRLELRAAGRAGTGAVPADVRLRGRLHAGSGGDDLLRRRRRPGRAGRGGVAHGQQPAPAAGDNRGGGRRRPARGGRR